MPNTASRVPTLEGYAPSSSQEMTSGLSQSRTRIVDERSFNDSTCAYGNSLLPLAAASYSQPDLSGNAGFGTRVDSRTRWMTPRRANTMELEEGKKVSFPVPIHISFAWPKAVLTYNLLVTFSFSTTCHGQPWYWPSKCQRGHVHCDSCCSLPSGRFFRGVLFLLPNRGADCLRDTGSWLHLWRCFGGKRGQ